MLYYVYCRLHGNWYFIWPLVDLVWLLFHVVISIKETPANISGRIQYHWTKAAEVSLVWSVVSCQCQRSSLCDRLSVCRACFSPHFYCCKAVADLIFTGLDGLHSNLLKSESIEFLEYHLILMLLWGVLILGFWGIFCIYRRWNTQGIQIIIMMMNIFGAIDQGQSHPSDLC